MTVWWCRGCGLEDTRVLSTCPSCGSAIIVSPLNWLDDGEVGDETVYELETEPAERVAVVEALMAEGIRHRWDDVSDLVVAKSDEEAVDKLLDDVLGDELVEVGDEDDDAGDVIAGDKPFEIGGIDLSDDDAEDVDDDAGEDDGGESYEVMSRLFLTTDRLMKRWEDEDVNAFLDDTGALLVTPTPFGVEDESWADIQSLARNAAAALEVDREADIEPQLKELHGILHALV